MDDDYYRLKNEQLMLQQRLLKIEQMVITMLSTYSQVAYAPSNAVSSDDQVNGAYTFAYQSSARFWTDDEHERYLEGVYKSYSAEALARHVRTRDLRYIRSHAQKYIKRINQLLYNVENDYPQVRNALARELAPLATMNDLLTPADVFRARRWDSRGLALKLSQTGFFKLDTAVDAAIASYASSVFLQVPEFAECYIEARERKPELPDPNSTAIEDFQAWNHRSVQIASIQHALSYQDLLLRTAEAVFMHRIASMCLPYDESVRAVWHIFYAFAQLARMQDPEFFQMQHVLRFARGFNVDFKTLVVLRFCMHCFIM